ncbi:recombinase family protein [bacterium]|nr:recombinase family protein [bacterium]
MAEKIKAVGYARVSGKGQVEGYGIERQADSIQTFADKNEYQIVEIYREEGISGIAEEADRPAFKEMLVSVIRQKIGFIIIEGMDRLARELRVQENLCVYIASKGIQLISANTGENITKAIEGDPMKKALIQIQGVFAELDKNQIVRKLRNGRNKARLENEQTQKILTLKGRGKCEGRKSYKEMNQQLIETAKKFYRKPRNGTRLSLLKISEKLYELGFMTSKGKPFSASQVKRLVE